MDKGFAYWHSATFNNDGTKVVFTDEWGGGSRPRCRADRSPDLGRRRDLRHRRPEAAVQGLLQDAGGADRAGELRRPQRIAHPGARARHHGAVVVPGRRVGVRLHRFGEPGRDRVLRSRSDRRREAGLRRVLVQLLLQRLHLRRRDRARDGHPPPAAGRAPHPERARRGVARALGGVQLPEPAEGDLADVDRRRPRLPRSVEAQQGRHRRPGPSAIHVDARSRGTRVAHATEARAAAAAESDDAGRRISSATRRRPPGRDAVRMRALAETVKGRAAQLR